MWIGVQIDTTKIENKTKPQIENELKKKVEQAKKLIDLNTLLVWAPSSEENCALLKKYVTVLASKPIYGLRFLQILQTLRCRKIQK